MHGRKDILFSISLLIFILLISTHMFELQILHLSVSWFCFVFPPWGRPFNNKMPENKAVVLLCLTRKNSWPVPYTNTTSQWGAASLFTSILCVLELRNFTVLCILILWVATCTYWLQNDWIVTRKLIVANNYLRLPHEILKSPIDCNFNL